MSAQKFDFYDSPAPPNRWVQWAQTIACWDGALPLAIGAAAPLLGAVFPRQFEIGTIVAVFLPIAGFFIRLGLGNWHFQTHPHYIWQRALFLVAIFWLIILDATLIMFRIVPGGIDQRDWNVWFMMYLAYVMGMAAALFPRHDPSPRPITPGFFEESARLPDH